MHQVRDISIHSLRMEGDFVVWISDCILATFQSTPSAWRETGLCERLPRHPSISIHSLRMEGDRNPVLQDCSTRNFNPLPPHGGRPTWVMVLSRFTVFQSTPSAWRETNYSHCAVRIDCISIHSLRMEGDKHQQKQSGSVYISIHSLRMEGDPLFP